MGKWEPAYGFCAYNETERLVLAKTLEAIRRRVCCYGGGNSCDCKYGLSVLDDVEVPQRMWGADQPYKGVTTGRGYSEATGCPELRELIHRLLHRDVPLV